MKRFLFALVAAAGVASVSLAQHPDPNRPYTVVSGYSPVTGGYSNTEYFTDRATGLPVQRGYGYGPAVVVPPVEYAPAWYPAPSVVYYPWPAPPAVYVPRYWRGW